MSLKYLLRFDDITPELNWINFEKFKTLLLEKNIKPILGIVPENRDGNLKVNESNPNFWELMRELQDCGWEMAQHGCYHIYNTLNGGILKLSNKSEFAGLSYERQLELLRTGQQILSDQGIHPRLFMAPSHSFDLSTLKALKRLGFKGITDGYSLFPYRFKEMILIPQLYATPRHHSLGVYTICIHLNTMSNHEVERMLEFINKNEQNIICVDDALLFENNSIWNRSISRLILRSFRFFKQKLIIVGKFTLKLL